MLSSVITTIFRPSTALFSHAGRTSPGERELVIVADRQTPAEPYAELEQQFAGVCFLSVARQDSLAPRLAAGVPFHHYARKNLGYIHAIRTGAAIVFDTDDDTLPGDDGWQPPRATPAAVRVNRTPGDGLPVFFNAYSLFTRELMWPRGFPLDLIQSDPEVSVDADTPNLPTAGVWQGLVDGDPDVDAIYRLTRAKPGTRVTFDRGPGTAVLDQFVYCPFNTQNTWWTDPALFAQLYLPSTVTSRACDILRSYVAQRCLWVLGSRLGE